MEKKLTMLMDYQRFAQREKLKKIIEETESRYEKTELDLDELDQVNAAGSPYIHKWRDTDRK